MPTPAQARLVPQNLRDQFLLEKKPIVRLRVLALNPYKTSWVQDAKSCARIYVRMLQSKAVCPRLIPWLSRWAQVLLEYAPEYGFGSSEAYMVRRRPTITQTHEWLRRLLEEIAALDSVVDIYRRMVVKFYMYAIDNGNVVGITDPICAITHRPMKSFDKGCWWMTEFENGKEIYSRGTGVGIFQHLEKLIKQGIWRHSKKEPRERLLQQIRKRNQHE